MSYLDRKMLPVLVAGDQRLVAPGSLGFGWSDKPEDASFYTFTRHRDMLLEFIKQMGPTDMTLEQQQTYGAHSTGAIPAAVVALRGLAGHRLTSEISEEYVARWAVDQRN